MGPIKLKTWITWAVSLFILGVLADYYFLHILFQEKQDHLNGAVPAIVSDVNAVATGNQQKTEQKNSEAGGSTEASESKNQIDNFLISLQKCAPEISAQGVATPEALIAYLSKTIGIKKETVTIENFHLLTKDGQKMRIHVVESDNTNSKHKKEIRLFKVDNEGYPDPVELKEDESLASLIALGQVTNHEVKSELLLKDGGAVNLETHNNEVFEFQYKQQDKILSCRLKECQCP